MADQDKRAPDDALDPSAAAASTTVPAPASTAVPPPVPAVAAAPIAGPPGTAPAAATEAAVPPQPRPAADPGPAPGAPAPRGRWSVRSWRPWAAGLAVLAAAAVGAAALLHRTGAPVAVPTPADPPRVVVATRGAVPRAAPPGPNLPTITYLGRLPKGLPADPAPMSAALLTTVVHPERTLPVYDRPGGKAVVFLPEKIHNVPVYAPLVRERTGWIAVLLPSGNRTMGWLPPGGWSRASVRDQVVIRRRAHTLTWLRDGERRGSWTVSVGSNTSPTPLGRSFVFGRSSLSGEVYAGLDVLALGAVPDDPDSVPAGLRGAHIGIHSWYRDTFGGNTSDGCVQVPPAGHKLLLANLTKGSGVLVLP
ncbi:L,D-transpeptidase [Pilimelia anulata]|uniref:L,D-transpeptidase n=1 Tax=Pilimelia anulata TaxID=53371 RepID=UPI0016662E3F|nr:L,D-transpeptidase [Pilimelia anulata]